MLRRLEDFYDRRVDDYPEHDRTAEVRYRKALRSARLRPGARILDIGCKDARLYRLASAIQPDLRYVGVDISARNIERCKERHPECSFIASPIEDVDPEALGTFDFIFALEVLEHLRNPGQFVESVRRLLAKDGELIVSVPNPYYYMEIVNELRGFPDTEGHLCSFTDANLRALLDLNDFEILEVVGTYILVPKRLRGAFRTQNVWIIEWAPRLLACSRVYRCRARS